MRFNRKGQIGVVIFLLILVVIVFFSTILGRAIARVTIDVTRKYSDDYEKLDAELYTLLNYNKCENSKLPLKELIGLSISTYSSNKDSFNKLNVDYGGDAKEVDISSCIENILIKFNERNSKNYEMVIQSKGVTKWNTIHIIIVPSKIGEDKLSVIKVIPVPLGKNYARIYLSNGM